jgi:hypothetical protein
MEIDDFPELGKPITFAVHLIAGFGRLGYVVHFV